MIHRDTPFSAPKTFGLSVLLKLTKKHIQGIEILTHGNRIKSNMTLRELRRAVEKTVKAHNIKLTT